MLDNDPKKNVDKDPFGFTGGLDAGNGKWELGARFYDSGSSSFIQQDRYLGDASDPLSLNRYSYCGLDPVNFVDPTGFMAEQVMEFGESISGAGPAGKVVGMIAIAVASALVYCESQKSKSMSTTQAVSSVQTKKNEPTII